MAHIGGIASGWGVVATEALDVLISNQVDANGEIGLFELQTALQRMRLDPQKVENVTKSLLDIDVLTLGLRFKCTNCNRTPWYSLEDVATEMMCTYCRGALKPERHSKRAMTRAWTYRLLPPLDKPAYRSNLFGIFGAAGYFHSIRNNRITLALGLNVRKGDEQSELDLTVLVQERGEPAGQKLTTVFVEAKGLAQKFDDDDIASFEKILPDFPGATYVFSTLRDGLADDERSMIRTFLSCGSGEHGVAILTRDEMRHMFEPPQRDTDYWRAVQNGVMSEVCEATRKRYL